MDSLYVWKDGATREDYERLSQQIEDKTRLPLAIESIYRYVVFLPSKQYADVPVPNRFFAVAEDGEPKIRGLECRRHDTPPLLARMQHEVLAILAEAHDYDSYLQKLELARGVFANYEDRLANGEVDVRELVVSKRITHELVGNAEVPAIFEATFEYGGVLVRTDVLERRSRTGYRLIEVKSATGLKPHYAYDIGIQKHVLSGAGVNLEGTRLMHLNRDYVFDGQEYDVSRLFVIAEVPHEQTIGDAEISSRVENQLRVLGQPAPPDVEPGRQCTEPVLCEFYDHCNPDLPAHHVSFLPRMRTEKVDDLIASGIISVQQIPDEFPLSETQRRAVDAVKSGKMWISPELAGELSTLRYPICFMDFETIFPALPRFAGMRPYDHVPFQWSVHRQERTDASMKRYDFLAESASDPRIPFLESLCQAVKAAGSIVVYNQGFEASRLDDLARWLPEHRSEIGEIKAKLWDLLAVIRRNVYHPAFGGSFSLKKVAVAILPYMNYDGLGVPDGIQAGSVWGRSVDATTGAEEKTQLKRALLQYCGQDTLALARIVEVLMNEARASAG